MRALQSRISNLESRISNLEWPAVRAACHALLAETRARLCAQLGTTPLCPDTPDWYAQMAAIELPPCNPSEVQRRLWDEHRIEVPITLWNDRPLLRISLQAYNRPQDVERLAQALGA
jgi:isopenicillin-N epimerase